MTNEMLYAGLEEVFSSLSQMTVTGENTLLAGTAMKKLRELGIALKTEMQNDADTTEGA